MSQTASPDPAYLNSNLWQMKQAAIGKTPFTVIFSDLDDSLYHPHRPEVTTKVFEYCAAKNWPIAVVTGVNIEGVLARSQKGQFPPPHLIVGHVSTDIWVLQGDQPTKESYLQDMTFDKSLKEKFPRHEIVKKGAKICEELAQAKPMLAFTFQESEREKEYLKTSAVTPEPYKVSFYFKAVSPEELASVNKLLQDSFPDQCILVSDHTSHNRRFPEDAPMYCADILPVSKGDAVSYLADLLHIEQGIAAGDSGNDKELLLETPSQFLSVVAGGAKAELTKVIKSLPITPTQTPGLGKIEAFGKQPKFFYQEPHPEHLGPETILEALPLLPVLYR
ncbi:MAG: HAD hydrolase family protein [Candidatus Andersenbacteria bacterium]|nr:HAD hydrolase family protein [Candidatus Andersenbacteria bacterium]